MTLIFRILITLTKRERGTELLRSHTSMMRPFLRGYLALEHVYHGCLKYLHTLRLFIEILVAKYLLTDMVKIYYIFSYLFLMIFLILTWLARKQDINKCYKAKAYSAP